MFEKNACVIVGARGHVGDTGLPGVQGATGHFLIGLFISIDVLH